MKKKYVLIVEDNPDDVELTRLAFRKNKIVNDLVVATDGQQALDYLFCEGEYKDRNIMDVPQLILLDIMLPKVDGLEVLHRLRADVRTNLLPIVILTGSKEERDLIEAYKGGVNSYIRKPVSFDDFQEVVRNLGLYWLILNEPVPLAKILGEEKND
jgi:two-component system, response regulator